MDKLIIQGGVPLHGEVIISGAKNAALPILLASILVDEPIVFHNVPHLRDINTTLNLLSILGCEAKFDERYLPPVPGRTVAAPAEHPGSGGVVRTQPCRLSHEAPYDLVKTMRASVLCLGPLLARLGKAKVALPGGCAIGARPVNLHLSALEKMGAEFELDEGYIYGKCPNGLKGAHINFDFPTVGGTENLLMAATLAAGETILENAAREPEVVDLAKFLIACGADISGHGSSIIKIKGVPRLRGTSYSIMPDRIEAGTFMIAAAITDGELLIKNCPIQDMEAVVLKLMDMGVKFEPKPDGILVSRDCHGLRGTEIKTQPHPGFPTDMQAQIMALMCTANGPSLVEESIFENRFMHVLELVRMGADIRLSGHTALVKGSSCLKGAPVMASDLRASASLVLAGLAAGGQTEIQRIYHLDRGYERMEEKLIPVGARIKRVKE